MKLLVDNQLPEALARYFVACGVECRHVRRLGLAAATDAEIWNYARLQGFGIVTMDEDFQHLSARYGAPPQLVWVRLGNVRREVLIAEFSAIHAELIDGLNSGVAVIEIG